MTISAPIQGAGEPRELLTNRALDSMRIDERAIQPVLFPDAPQVAFTFEAPVYNDDNLVVLDDDTVGRDLSYPKDDISIGKYEGSIGMHGRAAHIPYVDRAKAIVQQRMATSQGGDANNRLFNLELMHTTLMLMKIQRHNEVLCQLLLRNAANYPVTHRVGIGGNAILATPLDVVNSPNVREVIQDAADLIADDGNGSGATIVVIPEPVRRGLQKNPAWLDLLPEDAIKRLSRADLEAILFPEQEAGTTSAGRVFFPNIRVKQKDGPNSAPFFLMDDFIGVYRVDPNTVVGANFGRNDFLLDPEGGQRYTTRTAFNVYGDEDIIMRTFYRPGISGPNYGVHIKVEINELE